MKKSITSILSILLIISTFTGCSMATPKALITAPKVIEYSSNGNKIENMNSIVRRFIPKGYNLFEASANKKSIIELDVDNDNSKEIIAFVKNEEKYQRGIVVIKKQNNKWVKIYENFVEANNISKVDMVNVYNKNQKSLLVGFFISGHGGTEYHVFDFSRSKVSNQLLGNYNKFEILNTLDKQDKRPFTFASWVVDIANKQICEVRAFDGKKLYPIDEEYKKYYEDNVIPYYKNVLKEEGEDLQYVWEKLAHAQIKAGKNEDALKSIDKALEIPKDIIKLPVDKYKLNYLKGVALNNLGKYEEAKKILEKAEGDILATSFDMDTLDFDISMIYLELGKIYASEKKEKEAKEMFNKSLNILKGLSKKEYFMANNYYEYLLEKELMKLNKK